MKLIEQIDIQPQSTKWLYDLNRNGMLRVDDSFQRNYVWLEKHQIKLLESVLMGSPIPEIYLWNIGTDSETGDTQYSIIDGQQRIGAIMQYIQNKYKLKEASLDSRLDIFREIKNRFFKDLEDKHKQAIWSYIFSVRIVRKSVERESIVQMFLRLNGNNMTLNPQELRNAEFDGEFINLATELADLQFWNDNNLFGNADRRRMRDITFISNLLIFIKLGLEEELTSKNINRIFDLFNQEYESKKEDKDDFIKVLEKINTIINEDEYRQSFLNAKVHLYTLFNYIYYKQKLNQTISYDLVKKYQDFIDNYEIDDVLQRYFPNKSSIINEYKAKSKEGTNQKTNRIRRFEILKDLLEN